MRTTRIALTLAGICLSPACGPKDPTGEGSGTGTTDVTTTTGEPTTGSSTSSGFETRSDESYVGEAELGYVTEPAECYFDEDCGVEMICDLGTCTPLPPLPACGAVLGLQRGAAELQAPGAVVVDIALIDLEGDGDLDVAVVEREPAQVELLINDGAGGFTATAELATGADTTPTAATVADVDDDGQPDLLVLSNADPGGLSLLRGMGGSLAAAKVQPLDGGSALAAVDVDGDAKLDLIVVGVFDPFGVLVHPGVGDGTFMDPLPTDPAPSLYTDLAVGALVSGAASDVATVGSLYGVGLHVWNADNAKYLGGSGLSSAGFTVPGQVAIGDFDGADGVDVVAGKSRTDGGGLSRWLGGGGSFGGAQEWFLPGVVDELRTGDLDADGADEAVLVDNGASELVAVFGLGAGPACGLRVTSEDEEQLIELAVGDVDGDGRDDMLSVGGGELRVFLSRP